MGKTCSSSCSTTCKDVNNSLDEMDF